MNRAGEPFEALACDHLQAAGLRLLARNFATRHGEIDLVMRDGDTLVFVEVRYRAGSGHGGGADSITAAKRGRLSTAAAQFLQANPRLATLPCRFDVVALGGPREAPRLDWRRAAFEAGL
ncbi:MAG: YraN family protein [Xanthomonadales bacterium]|nr:YraN family protein [Xanthomonadales bacterium]